MRYFKKIPFPYPELAGLVGSQPLPTEIEEFIANISKPDGTPAIRHWMQPGAQYYGRLSGNFDAWRDIASGKMYYLETGISLVQSAAINGRPTIHLDGTVAFVPQADTQIGTSAITFISVFLPAGTDAANMFMLGPTFGSPTAVGAPTILLTTTGFGTYLGGAGRINHDAADYLSATAKLMTVTMSPSYGVSIRRNGVEVVRDTTRTSPLSTNLVRLYGQPGANGRPAGDTGHVFIGDEDLSKPEYIAQLKRIEQYYMTYYGITAGS